MLRGQFEPAAAEGAVKLDDAKELVAPRLGEDEFGAEEFLLGIEHFEAAGDAAAICPAAGHIQRRADIAASACGMGFTG